MPRLISLPRKAARAGLANGAILGHDGINDNAFIHHRAATPQPHGIRQGRLRRHAGERLRVATSRHHLHYSN
jgi:hypothetical protein